jgi:hypothetical protein
MSRHFEKKKQRIKVWEEDTIHTTNIGPERYQIAVGITKHRYKERVSCGIISYSSWLARPWYLRSADLMQDESRKSKRGPSYPPYAPLVVVPFVKLAACSAS